MAGRRIVLITGANKGIGLESVRGVATRLPSATVYLGSRDLERGQSAVDLLGKSNVKALHFDLDSKSSVINAHDFLKKEHGRLDVLVNNAGVFLRAEAGDSHDTLVEHGERAVAVNYLGALNTFNTFQNLLNASEDPRVINVTSGLGALNEVTNPALRARFETDLSLDDVSTLAREYLDALRSGTHTERGWPGITYHASKVLENALTRALAATYPAVQVTAMCPGWCRTDLAGPKAPRSAEQGAEQVISLVVDDRAKIESGAFYQYGAKRSY